MTTNERKTTGDRNGYGAELANGVSTEFVFVVNCVDTASGMKFKQTFRNGMSIVEEPVIKKVTAIELNTSDYVQITYSPDLRRRLLFCNEGS